MVNVGTIIASIICLAVAAGIIIIAGSEHVGEETIAIGTAGSSGFGFATISPSLIVIAVAGIFGLFGFILLILGLVTGGKKEIIKEKVIYTPLSEGKEKEEIEEKKELPTPNKKPSEESKSRKRFCTECGNELKPTDKFCSECGTKVS
jgi:hypothetical protein